MPQGTIISADAIRAALERVTQSKCHCHWNNRRVGSYESCPAKSTSPDCKLITKQKRLNLPCTKFQQRMWLLQDSVRVFDAVCTSHKTVQYLELPVLGLQPNRASFWERATYASSPLNKWGDGNEASRRAKDRNAGAWWVCLRAAAPERKIWVV